jgi:hypothetical protein
MHQRLKTLDLVTGSIPLRVIDRTKVYTANGWMVPHVASNPLRAVVCIISDLNR